MIAPGFPLTTIGIEWQLELEAERRIAGRAWMEPCRGGWMQLVRRLLPNARTVAKPSSSSTRG
jgi:hypothetical protein